MPFHLCGPPISNFFPYLCRKTNARSKLKLELMFHPFLIPAGLRPSLPQLLWELSCTVLLGWAIPPSDSGPQTLDTQALPSGGQGQSAAALKPWPPVGHSSIIQLKQTRPCPKDHRCECLSVLPDNHVSSAPEMTRILHPTSLTLIKTL